MWISYLFIAILTEGTAGAEMATWFVTDVVDKAWEKYHKPIWITEFSKRIFSSNAQSAKKTAGVLESCNAFAG